MTPSRQSTRVVRGWSLLFPATGPLTSTASPTLFMTIESVPSFPSFEHHLASLPTSQDLMAEARREDPMFDQLLEQARGKLHRRLLNDARKGRISRLTAERLRCGLTQGELAERANMKQPNISRLERLGVEMRPRTARRLAKALGLKDYKVLLP